MFNSVKEKLGTTSKVVYRDENDFIKKMRSLRTYCPIAYKDLLFNVNIQDFQSVKDGIYEYELKTSKEFRFVYGQIKVVYSVTNGVVIIENLQPAQFLLDGYLNMLDTYKGLPYRHSKDKFKINMLEKTKKV